VRSKRSIGSEYIETNAAKLEPIAKLQKTSTSIIAFRTKEKNVAKIPQHRKFFLLNLFDFFLLVLITPLF